MSEILKNDSRLTINFELKTVVINYNTTTQRLKNAFDFILHPKHKSGEGYNAVDPQRRPFDYLPWRDQAERVLFQLSRHEAKYKSDQHNKQISVLLGHPNFVSATRPIYGSLDFTNNLYGGARLYGKSFIVLRPDYKLRCTFTPSDSIYLHESPRSITTFEHLENIIGLLDKDHFFLKNHLFINLIELARFYLENKDKKPPNTSGKSEYIEAQIHAKNLEYAECISAIYIDKNIYNNLTKKPGLFSDDQQKSLIVKTHQFINDIRDFCEYNSIIFSLI